MKKVKKKKGKAARSRKVHVNFVPYFFKKCTAKCRDSLNVLTRLFLLLNEHGVEKNPGPEEDKLKTYSFSTYNVKGLSIATCNGMRKFRKLINMCRNNCSDGNVICLQETHVIDTNYFKKVWQNEYIIANGTRASKGVAILVGKDVSIVNKIICHEGRYIICKLVNKKADLNVFLSNVYAPNNHSLAIQFYNEFFDTMENFVNDNSEENENFDICLTGDFNFVPDPSDCKNRNFSNLEARLAELVNDRLEILDLKDMKYLDSEPSIYTWHARGIFSRLDRFYVNQSLINKSVKVSKDWSPDFRSDHALIKLEYIGKQERKGPGILRLQQDLIKNPKKVESITKDLESWMTSVSDEWSPDKVWEFTKVGLHSIAYAMARKENNIQMNEKTRLQEKVNMLKIKLPNLIEENEINNCESEIRDSEIELDKILEQEADRLMFLSGLKWREAGEKSSKYFFGLARKRKQEATITMLKDGHGVIQSSLTKIMTIASTFYKDLYSMGHRQTDVHIDNDFFDLCPSLNEVARKIMDKDLTEQEILDTLKTCNESAPGPDGIPYSYYKTFNKILIPNMLKAWNWSLEEGTLCPSQKLSTIFIIPKKDKDKTEIKNWRPITLSNCDL
jgi:exonuclease III